MVNAEQGIGPGDRFIAGLLRVRAGARVTAVNKLDRVDRAGAAAALQAAADLEVADEILPVSARTGEGVPALREALVSLLPEGPFYFEPEALSDQNERFRLAELVREQVLARTREEVPHAVEVQIESIEPAGAAGSSGSTACPRRNRVAEGDPDRRRGPDDQVDRDGCAPRDRARAGDQVHLALRVRVRKHWRADEQLLDRLGIE